AQWMPIRASASLTTRARSSCTRRNQDAAGEMRAQCVEPRCGRGCERAELSWPRQHEHGVVSGGQGDRGRHAPADALRPPEVAIDRLLLQFLRREEIDVDQKSGVTLGEQARDDRAARKPAFAHYSFGALTRLG